MIIQDEKLLRQVSIPCVSVQEGLDIAELLKTEALINGNAIGLAAPQIGIFKRVFIIAGKSNSWDVYINPTIESELPEKMFYEEQCLSFPGIKVITHRPKQITVTNMESDGRVQRYVMYEKDAIIFQHENDHLAGKLMFDARAKSVPPAMNCGKNKIERNDPCPCGKIDAGGCVVKYKKCCGK